MCFALVACDNANGDNPNGAGGGSGTGGGGSSVVTPPEDYDPRDPEQYIYKSVFANSPYKDQWDTGYNGADLYGIWDQSVLPEGFPTKPDSVTEIDRTSYVGVLDGKLHEGGRQLGVLWVDDTDYQEYYVMFTGAEATFTDITTQLQQNFVCFDDREDGWGSEDRIEGYYYAFSNDWYLYMSYGEEREWSDETNDFVLTGAWSFTLYAIPKYYQLPKVCQGVNLPDFGYFINDVYSIQSWSEGDEDVAWLDYDYQAGTVTGTLGEYWASEELRYYGVVESQMRTYCESLVSAGFEKTEDGTNEYSQIYLRYKKGDLIVKIDLHTSTSELIIRVEYGDVWYY